MALSGSKRRMLIAVTLLPEPDSPTNATVVFSGMSKLTPRTASCTSRPMRKLTRRSRTSINEVMSRVLSTKLGVHRVAQCIGEQREGGDEGGHERGRGNKLPPLAEHELGLRLGEHGAPADH